MRSTFAALRIRNYRLFAIGSLVSNVGTWMQRVAQDWLVLALTGSAGALGITTGLQFLPTLLFSPFAGVLEVEDDGVTRDVTGLLEGPGVGRRHVQHGATGSQLVAHWCTIELCDALRFSARTGHQ